MIRHFALKIIKVYQKIFSLDHGFLGKLFPNTRYCKFTPTCSEYGYTAVERFGLLKGGYLAVRRLLKCNPWSEPGRYDPVPKS
jgi:putative membrane protein insertion efficiency factor